MMTWLLELVVVVLMVGGLVLITFMLAAQRNAVPPVFTPPGALSEVVQALDLPESGTLMDLGCGDGRVLAAVARVRPKLRLVGAENNPVLWVTARLRVPKAQIVMGQLEKVPLRGVERVFAYLGHAEMAALESKFEQLSKGARVVSQQFPLPNRKPDRVLELKHGRDYAAKLYIYDYR